MIFKTLGDKSSPAILFFHAMGVTGDSSMPVAEHLKDKFFCIMPTSTVYSEGQEYIDKADEIRQIKEFLQKQGVKELRLIVASSLGADLAEAFITGSGIKTEYVFFDGGQFAQIGAALRKIMTPFLYLAIKSLYLSKGGTLKKILWCDDDSIKPYFIEAGRNITYKNLSRQLSGSLEDKPFPALPGDLLSRTFFEFGSIEDHYKYRDNVMKSYPGGRFPVFEGYNHMQFQIRDPEGFAGMLEFIMDNNEMPELPFLRK